MNNLFEKLKLDDKILAPASHRRIWEKVKVIDLDGDFVTFQRPNAQEFDAHKDEVNQGIFFKSVDDE